VQNGQDDVEADRLVASLIEDEQPADASVGRQDGGTTVLPTLVRAVAELPLAVHRDPDVDRFVLLGVEALGYLAHRLEGDGVLFGAAAEDDPELKLVHAGSCFRIPGN
jgi:hypothetical protein